MASPSSSRCFLTRRLHPDRAHGNPNAAWPLRREFKRAEDMYAQDSIHLLEVSGIDFAQMEARGIEVHRFGEVLMSSGIVLNDEVALHTPCPARLLHALAKEHRSRTLAVVQPLRWRLSPPHTKIWLPRVAATSWRRPLSC